MNIIKRYREKEGEEKRKREGGEHVELVRKKGGERERAKEGMK